MSEVKEKKARAPRRSTEEVLNQKLETVKASIAKKEEEIKKLKEEEKQLIEDLKKNRFDEVVALIGEHEVPLEEVKKFILSYKK